jgi:hypothetical protein
LYTKGSKEEVMNKTERPRTGKPSAEWMSKVILTALALSLGLGQGGCDSGDPARRVTGDTGLARCSSCESLETYLKESATRMLQAAYSDRDGCFRIIGMPGFPEEDFLAPVPGGDAQVGEGHTTTNVQEPGVDEPDFLKNDSEYVYVLNGSHFLVYDVNPPEETHELSRMEIEGVHGHMFVREDMALIFSTLTDPIPVEDEPGATYSLKITLLNVANKSSPQLVREVYLQGHYHTARLVGGFVHVIVSSYVNLPMLDVGAPLAENLEKIERATLASWIPTLADVAHPPVGGSTRDQRTFSCEDFYLPASGDIHAILTILSFDLENPMEGPEESSILSPTSIAYASSQSIYVSHVGVAREDCSRHTRIHKFDIRANPGQAVYRASGKVPGWLLNQFSMGEHDGFLRVGTTEEPIPWTDPPRMSNNLFVLRQQASSLDIVGEVRGIAPGEQIYATRFLGDVGFMVTFERIDPLFTFDLSDPTRPRLLGELEVPGYSSYIHPAGDDHLLTIGQDAEDMGDSAWFQGIQISIYDVSDLTDPILNDMEIIGSLGTGSEALHDHKAFNYFPPKEVLAFPIKVYEAGQEEGHLGELVFSGFRVYDVDLTLGYTLRGQIDHDDFYEDDACHYQWMRRTVIMGNAIVTISNAGMKIHALDDPTTLRSSIPFPECEGYVYPFPFLDG